MRSTMLRVTGSVDLIQLVHQITEVPRAERGPGAVAGE